MTAPVLLSSAPVQYPTEGYAIVLDGGSLTPQLRMEAAQGKVVLRLLVRADGTVARVEVIASSGSVALDHAASTAAASWRFAPATKDGEPIEAWVLIPVRFVITQ